MSAAYAGVPSYTHTAIWIGSGIFLIVLVALVIWVVITGRRGR